ncbi:thioredoxin-dependent thiol peroxidase [Gracilinema caldarium]|uniref:thioredoxin-dependent peroxiredoxin n=1 Tax=Gracilinema caldarium (strain ATCC 51460 / DSM 7334 / H1) TaxID=744872 RepID=F8EX68_GRAC1|nr:thioredoxin-dependent thiol peroxidase [Gracilinema caldarium]AEJ18811.1 alkyl hydroperoxide reductase/ Thiol specific antioxidant/ Mal allergen [Gracilinema caldarium DSM 7334]
MLQIGDTIPFFELPDQQGKLVKSSGFAGKPLVIYFYPRDDTPGCTKEACSFRDAFKEFYNRGVTLIGISADTPQSHGKFASKYNLPFILLSDTEKSVIKAFGAWGEKKMYGKSYEGIIRSTFVINSQGKIVKVFPKVKPEDHAKEVLAVLATIS